MIPLAHLANFATNTEDLVRASLMLWAVAATGVHRGLTGLAPKAAKVITAIYCNS